MDIYYPKDNAVSHGKVRWDVLASLACVRGGSIGWWWRGVSGDCGVPYDWVICSNQHIHSIAHWSAPTQVHELLDPEVRVCPCGVAASDSCGSSVPADADPDPRTHARTRTQALKRGEPLTEESIRWLLELHGEMYLIEQHYRSVSQSLQCRSGWAGGQA